MIPSFHSIYMGALTTFAHTPTTMTLQAASLNIKKKRKSICEIYSSMRSSEPSRLQEYKV
jgi:hypothetical protein